MPVYVEPAWDAPLDVETYLRACPPSATIKGMFPNAVVAEAKRRGIPLKTAADKYLAFLDYPLVGHMRLILEAAPAFWPDHSLRQSLRKMGRAAIGAFTQSTIGKAVLGGLQRPDAVPHAMTALVRAYAIALAHPSPTVEVREATDSSCVLRMSDFWIFLDSHQVGIVEGLCRTCGVRPHIRIRTEGLAAGEFLVTWTGT